MKEVRAIDAFVLKHNQGDSRLPQVEAIIGGNIVKRCMLDGYAAMNVIACWLMDGLELAPTRNISIRLKVVNQRSVDR